MLKRFAMHRTFTELARLTDDSKLIDYHNRLQQITNDAELATLLTMQNRHGETLLHIAIRKGALQIAQHLLSLEHVSLLVATNDQAVYKGAVAIHYVVAFNRLSLLNLVLEKPDNGFDLFTNEDPDLDDQSSNEDDTEGETVLVGASVFHYAAFLGHTEILQALIAHQLAHDEELDDILGSTDQHERYPLYYAVRLNHFECTRAILQEDINQLIDVDSNEERRALRLLGKERPNYRHLFIFPFENQQWQMARIILETLYQKQDEMEDHDLAFLLNQKNSRLQPIIHILYEHNQRALLKLVLQFKDVVKVNARCNQGHPLYFDARMADDHELMQWLRAHPSLKVNKPVLESKQRQARVATRDFFDEDFDDGLDSSDPISYAFALEALEDMAADNADAFEDIEEDSEEGNTPLLAALQGFYQNPSAVNTTRLDELLTDYDVEMELTGGEGKKAISLAKLRIPKKLCIQLDALRADLNHALRNIRRQGKIEIRSVLIRCSDNDLISLIEFFEDQVADIPIINSIAVFKDNVDAKKFKLDRDSVKELINEILDNRFSTYDSSNQTELRCTNSLAALQKCLEVNNLSNIEKLLRFAKENRGKYITLYREPLENENPAQKIVIHRCPRIKLITAIENCLKKRRPKEKPYYFADLFDNQTVLCYLKIKTAYLARHLESSSGESEDDAENSHRLKFEKQFKLILTSSPKPLAKNSPTFVPIFRGINFLRDRFEGKDERLTYLLKAQTKIFFASCCYHLAGKKPTDDVKSEALEYNANHIITSIKKLDAKESQPISKSWNVRIPWSFSSYRHFFQSYYTFNKNGFDQNMVRTLPPEIRKSIEQRIPDLEKLFEENPFVSGSALPNHSVRYAVGMSRASALIDQVLNPRYSKKNGRPKKPVAGIVFLALYPMEEYLNSNCYNVVKEHANGAINISKELLNEGEITFMGKMDHVVVNLPIIYPSFEGEFVPAFKENNKDVNLYGLTKTEYEDYKRQICNSHRRSPERQAIEGRLRTKLVHFYSKMLMRLAQLIATKKGAKLAIEQPDGTFETTHVEFLTPYRLAQKADLLHKQRCGVDLPKKMPETRPAALGPEEADESSIIEESEQDSPPSQVESNDLVMTAAIEEDSQSSQKPQTKIAQNPSSWFNHKRKSEQHDGDKQKKVPSLRREN